MLKRNRKKWLIAGGGGLVLLAVILVALFQWPAHQFTLDVNPSLRITTNRMGQVIDIEALNSDGGQFLEGYEPPGRNLEVVINDLVDRMILTGHISGGRDNIVMITVDSEELDSKYLEKVNEAIAAFLQNRELEYRILNQGVTDLESEDRENQQEILEEVSPGKQALIRKLMEEDETLTPEEFDEISLGDLLRLAGEMNLSPNELFARIIGSDTGDDEQESSEPRDDYMPRDELDIVRGWDFAINAALEAVGGGMVVSFEYDQDEEYEVEILYNGYRYEIEMNAYTAEILEMEREADDQAEEYLAEQEHLIGWIQAVEIAEEEIGGGQVMELEYNLEDGEYKMEIRYHDTDYDIEMNAYTGEILEIDPEPGDDRNGERDPSHDQEEVIGEAMASELALEEIGGGTVMEFEYDRDDGIYEMEIKYEGYEYEITMDAYTGDIIEFERDEDDDYREGEDEEVVIGMDRAVEIAKERIGGGVVIEFEYDMDDGEYEMEIKYDGNEYDVKIDAYTGEILDFDD